MTSDAEIIEDQLNMDMENLESTSSTRSPRLLNSARISKEGSSALAPDPNLQPPRSPFVSPLKLTPLRSERKIETPSSNEMETIDLTGDRERFVLFSANDLEKPCRLWAGTSAIKGQCGEKRGKKRRSDEYILNPPSPSKHTSSARSSTDDPLSEHSSKTSWVRPPNDAKQPRISSLSPRNGHRKQSIAHYNEENADGFTFDKDPVLRPQSSDISLLTTLQASFIGVSIRQLKQTLQENSEVVYWQAIKGQPAPDLIAENKSLVSRIQAIEALQFQQACYNSRLLKKEKLKQCLIRVISQGLDPATMPDELSESRIVQSELKQIETKIWELLLQAKIFDLTKGSGMDLPTPESSDFLSDRHTSVDRLQDLVYTKEQSPQNQDTPPRSPKVSRRNLVTSVRQGISVDGSEEERVARKMRSSTIDLDDFEWSESDAEMLEVFGSSNNG
ncbi:Bloom syndrome protein [Penicillium frequentans]|nr:Bloom syndrome protein [Penicillium glabrum]KAJ5555916.1 Bloom syndrome protein [Penicillium glabrum]